MGYIYLITSPTGRLYVGQTKRIAQRISLYKYKTRKDKGWKNAKIMNSIKKYGWDAHKFEILEECGDDALCEREVYWIAKLGTFWLDNPHHMNMSKGGESGATPWMYDKERRERQSKAFTGSGNPFSGKTHTKEWRKKKSEEVSMYNKKIGKVIPAWGVEKGRLVVIKPVLKYDKKGNFVQEYASYTEAGESIGVMASRVWESISGRKSQCSGWHFRSKTENYPLKIDVSNVKNQNIRRPVLTLTPEYDIICEHPSAQEASEFWGVPKTTINRAAMYNWLTPIRSGHVFIYSDLYEGILKAAS